MKSKLLIFPGPAAPLGDIRLVNLPVLALLEIAGERGPLLLPLFWLDPKEFVPSPFGMFGMKFWNPTFMF